MTKRLGHGGPVLGVFPTLPLGSTYVFILERVWATYRLREELKVWNV